MKKVLVIIALVGTMLVGGLLARPARAATDVGTKSATIAQGAVHNGLYAKAAETVEINGVVNGDVIVLASTFTLKGTVNGSLYVLAEKAVIDGAVGGNVHVAASDVRFGGQARSLYSASSSFESSKLMRLNGTLAVAASSVEVAGQVDQSAYVAASVVRYDAATAGSVKIAASEIEVGSNAVIGGDLSYSQSAVLNIANDKNIAGSIEKFAAPQFEQMSWSAKLAEVAFGVLSRFILGMVALWLLPATVVATANQLKSKPGRSLLVGFGVAFGAPFVIVALLLTLVGAPLALIAVGVYILLLMTGGIIPSLLLGRQLLGSKAGTVSARANAAPLLIGLIVIGLLGALPVVGGLVAFATTLAGVGALVARNWQRTQTVRKSQLGV